MRNRSFHVSHWMNIGTRMRAFTSALFLVAAAAATVGAQSQNQSPLDPSIGVLIVAHGAGIPWNARVDSLASAVRRGGVIRGPVGVTFLMGPGAAQHRFQDEVAKLQSAGAKQIVVVPALVSSHSGHYDQIRFLAGQLDHLDETMLHHLHMSGLEPVKNGSIVIAPALDNAPELATALASLAKKLEPTPTGRALFLFGHGPNSAEDYAAWMANLRPIADSVKAKTGFASVVLELVRDDAPAPVRAEAVKRARELVELQQAATKRDVVVVPILISSGDVGLKKLPADLAGLPIVYTGDPLLLDTQLSRWVERRVVEATSRVPATTVR